ncbi:succinate-acetate transporter protein [Fictibacillus halophilus]|uniref:Succinate-acetate transporter protein n=1 Tax=Fictibacillus halophilus TaxID=1610490 RepID=A0ABV2LI78_9BACL|nr:hypothetical protein [Fictibacillus halophilus]
MNSINKGAIWVLTILSLITIVLTFIELNQPYETPEDAQSRFELHVQPIFTMIMIGATFAAFKLCKKVQLFAGPLFILLGGFWYFWLFLTFTIGWVRMQGLVGLAFSIFSCFFLTIYHLYTVLKNRNKPSM